MESMSTGKRMGHEALIGRSKHGSHGPSMRRSRREGSAGIGWLLALVLVIIVVGAATWKGLAGVEGGGDQGLDLAFAVVLVDFLVPFDRLHFRIADQEVVGVDEVDEVVCCARRKPGRNFSINSYGRPNAMPFFVPMAAVCGVNQIGSDDAGSVLAIREFDGVTSAATRQCCGGFDSFG